MLCLSEDTVIKSAWFLLSVGLAFQVDLEQGLLSHAMRQAFENHGISLSGDVTITTVVTDSQWRINDSSQDQTYSVLREHGGLNIYSLSNVFTTTSSLGRTKISGGTWQDCHHVWSHSGDSALASCVFENMYIRNVARGFSLSS